MSRTFTRSLFRAERDSLAFSSAHKLYTKFHLHSEREKLAFSSEETLSFFQYLKKVLTSARAAPIDVREYSPERYLQSPSSNARREMIHNLYAQNIENNELLVPLGLYQKHKATASPLISSARFLTSGKGEDPFANDRWKEDNSEEERQALNAQNARLARGESLSNEDENNHDNNSNNEAKADSDSSTGYGLHFFLREVLPVAIMSSAAVIVFRRIFLQDTPQISSEDYSTQDLSDVSFTSAGMGVHTFEDARTLSLPAVLSSVGYTSLCLQESLDALNGLRSRLRTRENTKPSTNDDFDDVSAIERHLVAEYERAVSDLKDRLHEQQKALVWSFQHCLKEISPQYGALSKSQIPVTPTQREKRLKELTFFVDNLTMALWRPRSSTEKASLDQLTTSLDQSGVFGSQETNTSSSKNSFSPLDNIEDAEMPKVMDPNILKSYNQLLEAIHDSLSPYFLSLPDETAMIENAIITAKRQLPLSFSK